MERTFRILSIDGGGIRGLILALVLAELENETQRPISELFDLVAGTSTGGIVALSLACPVSTAGRATGLQTWRRSTATSAGTSFVEACGRRSAIWSGCSASAMRRQASKACCGAERAAERLLATQAEPFAELATKLGAMAAERAATASTGPSSLLLRGQRSSDGGALPH